MRGRFTVLKNQDIEEYLSSMDRRELLRMMNKIETRRKLSGRDSGHTYLVINTDEPYADQVIEIMRKHNHWEG
ncbi:hypothetical protein 035JT001_66 [Bacillus phage 035JT001]|nr:hypothetical protein 035JT001_66 [Bacillus phage 035JT001]